VEAEPARVDLYVTVVTVGRSTDSVTSGSSELARNSLGFGRS
jgi:hypothetical protein